MRLPCDIVAVVTTRSATRLTALFILGFASGVPYVFSTDNLRAWMTQRQFGIDEIGLVSLAGLPYVLKFLWAPLMDRYVPPLLGRRRGWLLIAQLCVTGSLLAMAFTGVRGGAMSVIFVAMTIAFFGASQDIAGDAYRTDVLPAAERGLGTAAWVSGWRGAVIIAGAGALVVVGRHGFDWGRIYLVGAGLMAIGIVGVLIAPEPEVAGSPPPSLFDAVVLPLRDLFERGHGMSILLMVVLFKLPEVLATQMSLPFMLKIGIAARAIGVVRQGIGIGVTIAGTFVGGAIVARVGLYRSLWIIGLAGAVSNGGFLLLSHTGPVQGVMVAAVCVESFCAGMVTAVFVAFLMSQCSPAFSATQFALLSGLMRLTDVLSGWPAGKLVQHAGWSWFFFVSVVAIVPALMSLPGLRGTIEMRDVPKEPRTK